MLKQFLEASSAVCASLLDRKLRKGASDGHTLIENDITAQEMAKLLRPVKPAIMSEEEQPTRSVGAPLQTKYLDNFQAATEGYTLITEMKQPMAGELEQQYVNT